MPLEGTEGPEPNSSPARASSRGSLADEARMSSLPPLPEPWDASGSNETLGSSLRLDARAASELETAPDTAVDAPLDACPRCQRPCAETDVACALCGELLRSAAPGSVTEATVTAEPVHTPSPIARPALPSGLTAYARPDKQVRAEDEDDRILGVPEPWFYLGIGLLTAPLFGLTPLVRLMGWFLGALTHEMGHALVAWCFGMPAFPAISLTAEAAAIHGEQVMLFVLLIWGAGCYGAWRIPHKGLRFTMLPVAAVLYPLFAFTGLKELLFLVGGHVGELVFGAVCLHRCLHGGFSESRLERGLYGTVGWFLIGSNVLLAGGLMFSASRKALYASNGSFGLKNDYLRLAEDVLGMPLEAIACGMGLVALVTPLVAFVAWRLSERAE